MYQNKNQRGAKFKPLYMLVFAILISAVGYKILFQSSAAPAAPTIYITPETQTYAKNTTFTVAVRANSGTQKVTTASVNISYSNTLLEFVSLSNANSAFPTTLSNSGGNGQVLYQAGVTLPNDGSTISGISGDNLIATITFRTRAASGTANLSFIGESALIDINNSNIVPLSNTGGSAIVVDATNPTASVTAPTNGTVIGAGTSTNIAISASDNTGVASVDLYIDGALKTTLSTAPYNYTWNTSGLSLGNHTIQAKAKDRYGGTGDSTIITVSLADRTAPSVSLTAPANSSTLKGNQTISANANDETNGSGIAKVEFYIGSTLIGTDTTSPYSVSWNSASVGDGSYAITARAYDKASPANTKTSNPVNVTVDNVDGQAPTQPTSLRTTSTGMQNISLAWNQSTDNVGVAGYKIYRNNSLISTVTSLSFNDTGLAPGTSYSYRVSAVDAAGNESTSATINASTSNQKIGDFNVDGSVNQADFVLFLLYYGQSNNTYDLNSNGKVDIYDFSIFLGHYNT